MQVRSLRRKRLYSERLEDRVLLAADILQESGRFVDEVDRLKQLAFRRDSNAYVAPTAEERASFSDVAAHLIQGELQAAADDAASLGYEVVEFVDDDNGVTLVGLREELVAGAPTRGWGSYFANLSFETNSLVEVPHPIADLHTPEVGVHAFLSATGRGFLMAGAHRNANGFGTADVAHLPESIFHVVHEVWNAPAVGSNAIQIHGFDLDNHDGDVGEASFPAGTDVVLSATDGTVSLLVEEIDASFETAGADSYAYNTLDPSDPANLLVNDGVDGTTFSSLAGTTNAQAAFTTAQGSLFLHLELEQSIRFDAVSRVQSAMQIGDAIRNVSSSTKFYVVDNAVDKTYEYDAAGVPSESYVLAKGNASPRGAAADSSGTTVWVIDKDENVYVYDDAGTPLGNWEAKGIGRPEGIASDGTDVWIVDRGKDAIHFFAGAASVRSGSMTPTSSFSLSNENRNARGVTTDGTHLWVVNARLSVDEVFKYSAAGDLVGRWTLDQDNRSPRGITIDPANPDDLWVVDKKSNSVFQYLGGGQRTSGTQAADAVFAHLGSNPQGIADPPPPSANEVVSSRTDELSLLGQRPSQPLGAVASVAFVGASGERFESVSVRESCFVCYDEVAVGPVGQVALVPSQALSVRGFEAVGRFDRAIVHAKASTPTDDISVDVDWDSLASSL